jgi:hypothetical protein
MECSLGKKFPAFYGNRKMKGVLEKPTFEPYPKPYESSPHPHAPFFQCILNFYFNYA